MDKYEVLDTLQTGKFGRIHFGTEKEEGRRVAIKTFEPSAVDSHEREIPRLREEADILGRLKHPNIVEMIEFVEVEDPPLLVLEFVDGLELSDHMRMNEDRLPEADARRKFRQIADALDYLHRKRIVHLDLKPSNIMVQSGIDVIKIIDFGLSYRAGDNLVEFYCGTPEYTAPEVFSLEPYDGYMADVWSFGVCLFHSLTGQQLYTATNHFYYVPITSDDVYRRMQECEFPSMTSRELVSRILRIDPERRLGLDGIRSHRWFQE